MVRKMMLLNRASTMTVAALVVGVMGLASLPSAQAANGGKGVVSSKGAAPDMGSAPGADRSQLQQLARSRSSSAIPAAPNMAGTSAACNTARATLERRNQEIRACVETVGRAGTPITLVINAGEGVAYGNHCRSLGISVPTIAAEYLTQQRNGWGPACDQEVIRRQALHCGISNNGSEDSAVRALHQEFNRQMIGCLAAGVSENSVCTTVSRDSAAPLARMQEIRSQVAPLDSVLTNSSSLITRTNTEVADLNQQIINARNQIVNLESFIRARQNTINEATANVAAARTSRTTLTTEFSQRKADYDRLLARLNGVNCGSVAYPAAAPLPAMPAIAGH